RLREEYVDVYGIPFSVIPFRGKSTTNPPPPDAPVHHVVALPERSEMEIRFPVVEGYTFALRRNAIRCDIDVMEPLYIEPNRVPTATYLQLTAGYREGGLIQSSSFEYVEQNREEY